MDVTDSFFAGTPQRTKRLRGDLETAMAELLELRARVEEAARFSRTNLFNRKSPCFTNKLSAARRRSAKPRNRSR